MRDNPPKYILHPGNILSKNDGQLHHISPPVLARLYGVRMDRCVVFEKMMRYKYPPDWVHLWPSYDGNYELPVKD
jgi:hypothetical protein